MRDVYDMQNYLFKFYERTWQQPFHKDDYGNYPEDPESTYSYMIINKLNGSITQLHH